MKKGKALIIEGNQATLIQAMRDKGVKEADKIIINEQGRVASYQVADQFIRSYFSSQGKGKDNNYDYIQYNNPADKLKAVEYHDLKDNNFYSVTKEYADLYAPQAREAKYKDKPDPIDEAVLAGNLEGVMTTDMINKALKSEKAVTKKEASEDVPKAIDIVSDKIDDDFCL